MGVGAEACAPGLELAVEVDGEVEAVVVGEAVVVAAFDVGELRHLVGRAVVVGGVVAGHGVALGGEGGGVAGGEDPCGADVAAVAEAVAEDDGEVVAPVVLGGELLAAVEPLPFAVEDAHGAAPGVGHPAGELAEVALGEELDAVAVAVAGDDEVLPVVAAAEEGGAVFVFYEVGHALVVAFHREVGNAAEAVEEARGHLVALHGHDLLGDGHPEVGGQADARGGEEVYVLLHPGVAGLDGEAFGEHHAAADAGLQRGVEGVANLEAAGVDAGVDLDGVADAPVVFGEEGHLVGHDLGGGDLDGGVEGAVHLERVVVVDFAVGHLGAEPVAREVGAVLDGVRWMGGVVKVEARREVLYARTVVAGDGGGAPVGVGAGLLKAAYDVVVILGVGHLHVHEGLGGELVVPAQGAYDVAPGVLHAHAHVLVEGGDGVYLAVHLVLAPVDAAVEARALAELVRELGVEVVEVVARVELGVGGLGGGGGLLAAGVVDGHDGGYDEEFGIGAARRDAEGGLLFDDGPLDVELGGDEAYGEVAVQLLVVAVVLRDVEHRAQAAAEAGGEGAFVEGDVLHGVGVEGREEAAEVADVVEGHAVEEEEVLVGAAAAHVHAAVALAAALHAGHQLQGLDDVGLAEHHGYGLDLLHGHLRGAHLRRAGVAHALGGDDHLVELHAGHELDGELTVGGVGELEELGLVAHILHFELHVATGGQGEREAPVGVGDGAFAAGGVDDGGTDEGLAALAVADGAADGIATLRHGGQRE